MTAVIVPFEAFVPDAETNSPVFTSLSDPVEPFEVKTVDGIVSMVAAVPLNDERVIVVPETDVTLPVSVGRITFTRDASRSV